MNARIVLCSACGSEGRIYQARGNDPYPLDTGPCPGCKGTGLEVIDTQPIELEDLEEMAGAAPQGKER